MKYGFIKTCAVTHDIKVADVKFNTERIIEALKIAENKGTQLIVFPELSVCGYTCGDLFNQRRLTEGVEEGLSAIVSATAGSKMLVFVGAPLTLNGRQYNCTVAINNGKILGVVPKTFIPTYGEFYERRHFTPAEKSTGEITVAGQSVPFGTQLIFKAVNMPGFTVAAEICEDLWVPDSPSIHHAKAGANVIVNLSCSDETVGKADYRRDLVKMQSAKLICGYIYCDSGEGESTTDMTFAGHNLIYENGEKLAESKLFDNSAVYGEIDVDKLVNERRRMSNTFFTAGDSDGYKFIDFETDNSGEELSRSFAKTPFVPYDNGKLRERTELILSIQTSGLKKRFAHTNAKTAVIGISGGLDSALALLVTARAFKELGKPASDIIAITMPGFGTTGKTYNNSLKLIQSLGATSRTIRIGDSVLQHFKDIGHDPEKTDVTYENAQARMRTLILMDTANQTGGLVIGTGDLSELALGWATYNGDHMSMYAVNCSVPKTLVKHLVGYEAHRLGGDCEEVLTDILNTEISPELLPPDKSGNIAQKTEDLVGPYILHDFFLYYAIRWGFSPEKVRFLALKTFKDDFSEETIDKWLKNFYRRFFAQQFKRSCIPDGVKVGSVSLSPRGDWRMPSDASSVLWLSNLSD
ncbi:MAG: NAD(+) synthase [Candidatus Coproplasma sp.]